MLRNLFLLVLLGALLIGGYLYLVPGASIPGLVAMIPFSHRENPARSAAIIPPHPSSSAKIATPASNLPLQPIHLKNGTTLMGRIVISDAELSIIRTSDGKTTEVRTKDIVKTP